MKTGRVMIFGAALLALLSSACSSGDDATGVDTSATGATAPSKSLLEPFDTSGLYYENTKLGLTISEFEEWGNPGDGEFKVRDDGTFELYGEAKVSIDGLGDRYIAAAMYAEPSQAGDQMTVLTVDEDQEIGVRFFHYSPSDALLVIGDEEGGVFVFKEDDGTYGVVTSLFDDSLDEASIEIAESGYEAWQLLQQYNEFTATSAHSLLLAYGLVQAGPRPALGNTQRMADAECISAPAGVCCNRWNPAKPFVVDIVLCSSCSGDDLDVCLIPVQKPNSGSGPSAPVCKVFGELCDCIACQAAGKGDHCELCATSPGQ